MKNQNVVRSVHSHIDVPGDVGMDKTKSERKPDYEGKDGNTNVKVFLHRIPEKEFRARVNPAIARCLQDSKQDGS
ncbi:hypothetical protein [Aneurinibacillus migulanus]|uniref:Uncharacterized protein n=1 Tax=Aneurinibacillus migulanus TaxID=47500 RepID=A0A0D1W3F3_ANEMI|nr:hypothetical protein [Aneurinibacillus migulanus]KIV52915.1 hypothetical protein TS65_22740 [Aneurinibacillus migulanus]KON95193.1 hypothetical protein AF333_06580 [Aneurinibacillus migulanus]MED0890934.1 hypothetical protein [Aneurinibacillus migulanus]MED1616626.1 hypothetical protein [Aneurinibacillus migulanus]SDI82946.1 hypothetical protein SAMN04487909_10889 [Aneurinibacillus migulanus]